MRVVVVGAGPAGTRAAEALVEAGLRPVLVNEGPADGGQIYRRQPAGFSRSHVALYGPEAAKAEALHRTFDGLRERIDYRPETLAWNVTGDAVHTVREGRFDSVPYDALIVCSGATDRLMPVPGWDRAGCYSLGASQIALKSQACAIGSRVVFAGSGPLLYLVASQYVKAGANVAAVLDTSPAIPRFDALMKLLARPGLLVRGMGLVAGLRRAGVRVVNGANSLAIDGRSEGGVEAIRWRVEGGVEQRIECDAVALGWHLRAETQLADLARCEFRFDAVSRQWLPRIDIDGHSSMPKVWLAGDGARLVGADGGEASGRLAALAALADLGHERGGAMHAAEAPALRRTLATMERFRQGLAGAFPWPHARAADLPDDAIVCRCESIQVGELRRCVNELGSREVNRAKAFSRVGMGRCQGRFCGHASAEIIAQASGVPVDLVGRLRAQAPVKPLPFAMVPSAKRQDAA